MSRAFHAARRQVHRPAPVIVNIHGGPEGQSLPTFLGRNNYFLNEPGAAIVYPNVRGSTGHGKTFLAPDNGMKREDSYKDTGALLDWRISFAPPGLSSFVDVRYPRLMTWATSFRPFRG